MVSTDMCCTQFRINILNTPLDRSVHSCVPLQEAALTKMISPPLGNLYPMTHWCGGIKIQKTFFRWEQLWKTIPPLELPIGLYEASVITGTWFNSLSLILGGSCLPGVVPRIFPNNLLHINLRFFRVFSGEPGLWQ